MPTVRFALILVAVLGCTRDDTRVASAPSGLIGIWVQPKDSGSKSFSLELKANGTFTEALLSFTSTDKANVEMYKGTFEVSDNHIVLTPEEGTCCITPSPDKLPYQMDGNSLTLTFSADSKTSRYHEPKLMRNTSDPMSSLTTTLGCFREGKESSFERRPLGHMNVYWWDLLLYGWGSCGKP